MIAKISKSRYAICISASDNAQDSRHEAILIGANVVSRFDRYTLERLRNELCVVRSVNEQVRWAMNS